ncbi:uncharacterized protein FIBRA_04952 [Fibroporia radiculosa]|uniref:Golgi apparatus membrane protein TVP38 n=1 Tax=Fibroporia radiculosa TaxID=599839 RepID=J4GQ46_9APHY|nr:uncharacterized protein FIBRA_04952 [Fibroporia radiculosa]CCM02840.1 predicted protein [Fibroporia radiculosa]
MDHPHSHQARSQHPRALALLSGQQPSTNPARTSQQQSAMDEKLDEKALIEASARRGLGHHRDPSAPCPCTLSHFPSPSISRCSLSSHPTVLSPARPSPSFAGSASPRAISSWTAPTPAYTRPRGLRIANLLKPWIPIILYAITSLGFLAAISFWKLEVFRGLDALSHWLQSDAYVGYAVIFILIFITTFPPVPLYSTLVILSGYTFGAWTGAIISYLASLVGALTVFLLSRAFFRSQIQRWLACTVTIKRVVRAIEKRPKLLFLIRLAPYPYNVMNCLLAASSSLTFRTYTLCTALSLFKLIIHTSIGSSIHSFAEYHVKPSGSAEENSLSFYSTVIGIALCLAIFVYISYITRRAVNDELMDEDGSSEERVAFLAGDSDDLEAQMHEVRPVPGS